MDKHNPDLISKIWKTSGDGPSIPKMATYTRGAGWTAIANKLAVSLIKLNNLDFYNENLGMP